MNLWLLSGVPPDDFKKGSTSLIPKVQVVESPGENRPITLAGMICRIYHWLLAARLEKATRLRSQQRPFTTGDGITENVAIIRGVAHYCREKLEPLHVAFIDVAKAFDSVSHQSLHAATHRLGLPSRLTVHPKALYRYHHDAEVWWGAKRASLECESRHTPRRSSKPYPLQCLYRLVPRGH